MMAFVRERQVIVTALTKAFLMVKDMEVEEGVQILEGMYVDLFKRARERWANIAGRLGLTEEELKKEFQGWVEGPHDERKKDPTGMVREAGSRLIDEFWLEAKSGFVQYDMGLREVCRENDITEQAKRVFGGEPLQSLGRGAGDEEGAVWARHRYSPGPPKPS